MRCRPLVAAGLTWVLMALWRRRKYRHYPGFQRPLHCKQAVVLVLADHAVTTDALKQLEHDVRQIGAAFVAYRACTLRAFLGSPLAQLLLSEGDLLRALGHEIVLVLALGQADAAAMEYGEHVDSNDWNWRTSARPAVAAKLALHSTARWLADYAIVLAGNPRLVIRIETMHPTQPGLRQGEDLLQTACRPLGLRVWARDQLATVVTARAALSVLSTAIRAPPLRLTKQPHSAPHHPSPSVLLIIGDSNLFYKDYAELPGPVRPLRWAQAGVGRCVGSLVATVMKTHGVPCLMCNWQTMRSRHGDDGDGTTRIAALQHRVNALRAAGLTIYAVLAIGQNDAIASSHDMGQLATRADTFCTDLQTVVSPQACVRMPFFNHPLTSGQTASSIYKRASHTIDTSMSCHGFGLAPWADDDMRRLRALTTASNFGDDKHLNALGLPRLAALVAQVVLRTMTE